MARTAGGSGCIQAEVHRSGDITLWMPQDWAYSIWQYVVRYVVRYVCMPKHHKLLWFRLKWSASSSLGKQSSSPSATLLTTVPLHQQTPYAPTVQSATAAGWAVPSPTVSPTDVWRELPAWNATSSWFWAAQTFATRCAPRDLHSCICSCYGLNSTDQ